MRFDHELDAGSTEGGLPFLVLEYVDGLPLTEYCCGLGLDQLLELFDQAAGGGTLPAEGDARQCRALLAPAQGELPPPRREPTAPDKVPPASPLVRRFARELGVDAIVRGSLLRVGDDIEVTAQLIDADAHRQIDCRGED